MASITIAPRMEDPESDIEAVVTGGTVQIRIAYPVSTGGQWLLPIWSEVIPINGVPIVALLDPNATVPYEARFDLPTGDGDRLRFTEFRKVVDATPRAWDTLELVAGPGAPSAIPSDIASRVAALETTVAGISGGASTLSAISDMSPYMRSVNDDTNATAARATLGAASQVAVDTATATANAAIPSNTLGTGNGPAKLSADGLSVLKADGSVFTAGVALGQAVGTALDAGRYAGDIQDVPIVIHEGDPRYSNHPVTQRSVHFYGSTDPGNAGSRTLGGGGLAPNGVSSTGVPIIDKWFQVVP